CRSGIRRQYGGRRSRRHRGICCRQCRAATPQVRTPTGRPVHVATATLPGSTHAIYATNRGRLPHRQAVAARNLPFVRCGPASVCFFSARPTAAFVNFVFEQTAIELAVIKLYPARSVEPDFLGQVGIACKDVSPFSAAPLLQEVADTAIGCLQLRMYAHPVAILWVEYHHARAVGQRRVCEITDMEINQLVHRSEE